MIKTFLLDVVSSRVGPFPVLFNTVQSHSQMLGGKAPELFRQRACERTQRSVAGASLPKYTAGLFRIFLCDTSAIQNRTNPSIPQNARPTSPRLAVTQCQYPRWKRSCTVSLTLNASSPGHGAWAAGCDGCVTLPS